MSLAVRHRYEVMGSRPSVQYQNQQARIKLNAAISSQQHEMKVASDDQLKCNWKENAEGVCTFCFCFCCYGMLLLGSGKSIQRICYCHLVSK